MAGGLACVGGSMLELILTVCLNGEMATCKIVRLPFVDEGYHISAYSCTLGAMPEIAKWNEAHPKWHVVRWTCGVAGKNADL